MRERKGKRHSIGKELHESSQRQNIRSVSEELLGRQTHLDRIVITMFLWENACSSPNIFKMRF
jgi:hypothetical protein